MSRISVDVRSARIPVLQVGYQGENEVTDVLFDISSWITEFGEGVAQLRVKRPGNSEEESYVLSLTITDGIAVWTVSETDTFNKGNGKVQLSYLVGNIVKKAVIYPYKVGKSIVGADNPVDPFDSWIERSKAWAIGETLDGNAVPETDETYQNNAKYYAEQADILGSAQVGLATEQATLATEKATLATVKADAAAASEANAAASEAAVNGVSTQLTTRMTAIETEQSVQSARMDTFTSLPEGSTSGNAELADIRVGANGTTYDTAGNAVRGQISELKSDLGNLSKVYTLVDNKLIMGGIERDSSSFYLLKNIEVSVGETLFVKTSMGGESQIALFDVNGSAIRTFGTSDGTRIGETSWYEYTITVPNGAEKMGVSFYKLTANIDEVVIKTIKNFNFVLGALKEIDEKIEILQPILDKEIYFACGDSITHANHQGIEDISDKDVYCPLGGSDGFTDWKKKGYPYYISKKNNLAWYNYGIGGSTLTNISVNGITYHPFSEPNGRYTKLGDSVIPDYISIFFGWNDGYWGRYAQAEKWLKDTDGSTIYYPLSTSLIGTTHSDGTPYATQTQYDACNSVTETINEKTYTGLSLFSIKHLGNINSYDVTTWYGAWNTVLEYFIKKYPLAKIMPVVPYNPVVWDSVVVTKELREATRLVSEKWGLACFDFDSTEHQLLFNTATQFTDNEYLAKYRVDNLLSDGLHPNTHGYKYIANMIGSKLMSI